MQRSQAKVSRTKASSKENKADVRKDQQTGDNASKKVKKATGIEVQGRGKGQPQSDNATMDNAVKLCGIIREPKTYASFNFDYLGTLVKETEDKPNEQGHTVEDYVRDFLESTYMHASRSV